MDPRAGYDPRNVSLAPEIIYRNTSCGELSVSISEISVTNLNLIADKPTSKYKNILGLMPGDSGTKWTQEDSFRNTG
jgi:hypothetical protein